MGSLGPWGGPMLFAQALGETLAIDTVSTFEFCRALWCDLNDGGIYCWTVTGFLEEP